MHSKRPSTSHNHSLLARPSHYHQEKLQSNPKPSTTIHKPSITTTTTQNNLIATSNLSLLSSKHPQRHTTTQKNLTTTYNHPNYPQRPTTSQKNFTNTCLHSPPPSSYPQRLSTTQKSLIKTQNHDQQLSITTHKPPTTITMKNCKKTPNH